MIFASCSTTTNTFVYGIFTTKDEFRKNLKLSRNDAGNDFTIDKIETMKIRMSEKFKIHGRYLTVLELMEDINGYIMVVLDKRIDFGDKSKYQCMELKSNKLVLTDESECSYEDIFYATAGYLPDSYGSDDCSDNNSD